MPAAIEFWFDFTSPYSYLAAEKIDALAATYQRRVDWHPILLGVAFQTTKALPIVQVPLKGEYSLRDMDRSARFLGVPFKFPSRFPLPTHAAARAFYWLKDNAPATAKPFALAIFHAFFVADSDISDPDVVLGIAAEQGIDRIALAQAIATPEAKERLKQETATAIGKGLFGAPYIIVDGEPFWGVDRLPQIETWLATGGF
ncbi:MAG: 2-hydroxychromene-2-carboxylate isomerase [Rhodocyclales bacterium]|nr:2-hydroxychromene-2-carboxylate isomerase [Rhodocyclales bacterium]